MKSRAQLLDEIEALKSAERQLERLRVQNAQMRVAGDRLAAVLCGIGVHPRKRDALIEHWKEIASDV